MHVGGPSIFLGPPPGCLNNPIFSNLGLCPACWAHFMCHRELWPTSLGHPFSRSLGLAGRKHYQKITVPIFRLVIKNFAVPGYFPYILFLSLSFLLTFFRLVCYCSMWLSTPPHSTPLHSTPLHSTPLHCKCMAMYHYVDVMIMHMPCFE